jgi:hypothetical protein
MIILDKKVLGTDATVPEAVVVAWLVCGWSAAPGRIVQVGFDLPE